MLSAGADRNFLLAVSEKWSLFKGKVLNKDFLKKMPKIGPYLVLILSKSPYFQKSSSEKDILCHFSYLDNKISARMYIQTGHFRFCGLFGLKLEKMVVGLKSGITLSCASTPRTPIIMWRYRAVLIFRISSIYYYWNSVRPSVTIFLNTYLPVGAQIWTEALL